MWFLSYFYRISRRSATKSLESIPPEYVDATEDETVFLEEEESSKLPQLEDINLTIDGMYLQTFT